MGHLNITKNQPNDVLASCCKAHDQRAMICWWVVECGHITTHRTEAMSRQKCCEWQQPVSVSLDPGPGAQPDTKEEDNPTPKPESAAVATFKGPYLCGH